MRTFRENHQEVAVTNVIIHVSTNHVPRDNPRAITTKISKLLLHATKEFPNASVYFSAILLTFTNRFFETINHVNCEIFELCSYYHELRFIQCQEFAKNHERNKELFWQDMIHMSNNGLRQLARDFIKHVRFWKFSYIIILAYIFSYTQGIFLKTWLALVKSGLNFPFYVVCREITYCSLRSLFYFCKTPLTLKNLVFKWSLG